MYHKLAGMTGTAETEAGEFWSIYKLDVMVIPTNRPVIRDDQDDLIYKTKKAKYAAVIDRVVELTEKGRPVLVGTTDVETSELLSRMLRMRGIKHNVLNAKEHAREAEIRGPGRTELHRDHRHQHGRTRHRHQALARGEGRRRTCNHRYRAS